MLARAHCSIDLWVLKSRSFKTNQALRAIALNAKSSGKVAISMSLILAVGCQVALNSTAK
jgi:hypothetical protein